MFFFFFSSRRRHTRCLSDWSSDVCSSDLARRPAPAASAARACAGARALLAVLLALAVQAEAARCAVVEEIVAKINNRIITRRSEERRVGKECGHRRSLQQ